MTSELPQRMAAVNPALGLAAGDTRAAMHESRHGQLAKLRVPFPPNQISKLPKPTKKQTEELKADFKKGIRCRVCGGWHQPEVIHLDYVGHAALTDRLLDVDPEWAWEPLSMSPDGLPVMDSLGGMWIKLTVLSVTRIGYGHAGDKIGGDAIKEVIGDALRNAAMRFGCALDLWHKGDLHAHLDAEDKPKDGVISAPAEAAQAAAQVITEERQSELDEAALYLIEEFQQGRGMNAAKIWYDPATFVDNEERVYVWDRLKGESKLRAFIKSNKPEAQATQA